MKILEFVITFILHLYSLTNQNKDKMKKIVFSLIATAIMLVPAGISTYAQDENGEIIIDISPNVLNLQSSGTVFTVHTDIAYNDVDVISDDGSVTCSINGVLIDWWKSDARGNFVAKFDIEAIKGLDGLNINDYNTFEMIGVTINGDTFWGTQEILIKNIIPAGKK